MQNISYTFPYLFFIIVLFILYLYGKINNFTHYIVIKFCNLFAIIFIGLRGYIFGDWIIYARNFDFFPVFSDGIVTIIKFLIEGGTYEKGFVLFGILSKSIYNNYLFFQFLNYLFEIIILYFFLMRYVPNYYVIGFIIIFVVFGSLFSISMIRNMKAIMLFMLSIRYIETKNLKKYLFLNIIGVLFHVSAILYLPLYFLLNKKMNDIILLLLYTVGLFVFFLQLPIATTILTQLSNFMFGGRFGALIRVYIKSEVYSSVYGIGIGLIERIFSFFFIFYYRNKICKNMNYVFLNCFYIYSLIGVWFADFAIVFGRVGSLFAFSYSVLYPSIYSLLSKRSKSIFMCVLFIYSLLKLMIVFDSPLAKYENILTGVMDREERTTYTSSYIEKK